MNGDIGVAVSITNGLLLLATGLITTWRSVATTNVKSLKERLDDCELELDDVWAELTYERTFNRDILMWGHEASLEASRQGIILPDVPVRTSPPRARRRNER